MNQDRANRPNLINPYIAQPDGLDCFTKVYVLGTVGFKIGAFLGMYDILLITQPKGLVSKVARMASVGHPFAITGALFPALACALTNFRGKDDYVNYAIAGGVAGTYFGGAYRNLNLSIVTGAVGALMGYLFKDSLVTNTYWTGNREFTGEYIFDQKLYVNKRTSEDNTA